MTSRKQKPANEPAIDPEDANLWQQVAQSIKPLPGKPPPEKPVRPPRPKPAANSPSASDAQAPSRKPEPIQRAPILPDLEPGHAAGLDRRTAERLRRGQLAIDARLDLHGWTQAEAHGALRDFIEHAHVAGLRCVLVITGKGGRTSAEPGVLRSALPGWLNLPALRPLILGFAEAQPRHGGGGALYVLIKRRRQ